jgi:hypothetical protein
MRLVAAIVATSLGVAGIVPPALAQQPTLPSEQTPLEQSEQPMPPIEPPMAQAPPMVQAPPVVPPSDPAMAQARPPAPPPAPAQPAPMPPAVTPAPQPAPVVQQPDLFQETLKAQQRSVDRKKGLYTAGAVISNIFLIPGRAITCALGGGVGVGVLALTFGTGYKAAAAAFDEGCGGKWVVGPDDLRPDGDRSFDWER